MTFKHHYKKILRQVLSVGDGIALVADESKNRPPINFAKLGKRFAHLLLAAFRIRAGKNNAPRRGYEAVWTLPPSSGVVRFQNPPPWYLCTLKASENSPIQSICGWGLVLAGGLTH